MWIRLHDINYCIVLLLLVKKNSRINESWLEAELKALKNAAKTEESDKKKEESEN
jgi:hypothetical protein